MFIVQWKYPKLQRALPKDAWGIYLLLQNPVKKVVKHCIYDYYELFKNVNMTGYINIILRMEGRNNER